MGAMNERRSAVGAVWVGALATIVAGALAIACAWFFVTTRRGQVLDELALRGSHIGAWRLDAQAAALLQFVSVPTVAVGIVVVALVGLVRGRWRDALAAAVAVGGANVTTQLVKNWLLGRPDLISGDAAANSLPSGHTTVAASLVVGLVLVSGRYVREAVAVLGALAIIAFGYATLVSQWHRPADVVAAVLVASTWGLGAATAIRAADLGRGEPDAGVRGGPVVTMLLLASFAALATTGVLAAAVWGVGLTDASRSQSFAAYAGGAAALVGFTASCLGLLTAVAPRVRRDPAHS